MTEFNFRAWHIAEEKMYYRGYQKLTHILLCDDDRGENEGKGLPVKKATYEECELLQGSTVCDIHEHEIFEGDIVRVRTEGGVAFLGVVETIPDMFKSRNLHPLSSMLERWELDPENETLSFEVLGNRFENPEKIPAAFAKR